MSLKFLRDLRGGKGSRTFLDAMGLAEKPYLQLYPHARSLCSSLPAPAPCKLIIPPAALPTCSRRKPSRLSSSSQSLKTKNVHPPQLSATEVSAFSLSFGPYITVCQESLRDAWPLLTLTPPLGDRTTVAISPLSLELRSLFSCYPDTCELTK